MSSVCLPVAGDVYVPVKIEEDNLYSGIIKLLTVLRPGWPSENIKFKLFTDGITNKLVACQLNTDPNSENIVLVRIYGNKTDLLIDRNAELRNIKTLNILGLAPKVYGMFENGLAYQYYPGDTLTVDSVIDAKIWPLIACKMAKMHKVKLSKEPVSGYLTLMHPLGQIFTDEIARYLRLNQKEEDTIKEEPMVWDKIEQFLTLLPEKFTDANKHARFVNSFGSITKLRIEFERLKSRLIETESPIVFAHNDLLLGNVIYNQDEGTIVFIDYEYATYNYQGFDIANHFNEFVGLSIESIDYGRYPTEEYQRSWIQTYLTEYLNVETPPKHAIDKVYSEVQQLSLASHFMWGIWSLVQFELSDIDFDFGRYAEIRLGRYYETKDKTLKERS